MSKSDFFSEYDDLAFDVSRALHRQFPGEVARWIKLLEDVPQARDLTAKLTKHSSKEEWAAAYGVPSRGMGGGSLRWPLEKEERLTAQLDLFRLFAQNKWDAFQFAVNFVNRGSSNLNDMVQDVVTQIFDPLTRDLRRYIDQNWGRTENGAAPAADRVVTFDHNSKAYRDAIESLNKVRDAVAHSNEYNDVDDKVQRLSELDASSSLLSATRGRLAVFQELTIKCLTYLAKKFLDNAVSLIIKAALAAFAALLGINILT